MGGGETAQLSLDGTAEPGWIRHQMDENRQIGIDLGA